MKTIRVWNGKFENPTIGQKVRFPLGSLCDVNGALLSMMYGPERMPEWGEIVAIGGYRNNGYLVAVEAKTPSDLAEMIDPRDIYEN
jgi:hypothetical protein